MSTHESVASAIKRLLDAKPIPSIRATEPLSEIPCSYIKHSRASASPTDFQRSHKARRSPRPVRLSEGIESDSSDQEPRTTFSDGNALVTLMAHMEGTLLKQKASLSPRVVSSMNHVISELKSSVASAKNSPQASAISVAVSNINPVQVEMHLIDCKIWSDELHEDTMSKVLKQEILSLLCRLLKVGPSKVKMSELIFNGSRITITFACSKMICDSDEFNKLMKSPESLVKLSTLLSETLEPGIVELKLPDTTRSSIIPGLRSTQQIPRNPSTTSSVHIFLIKSVTPSPVLSGWGNEGFSIRVISDTLPAVSEISHVHGVESIWNDCVLIKEPSLSKVRLELVSTWYSRENKEALSQVICSSDWCNVCLGKADIRMGTYRIEMEIFSGHD